MKTLVNHTCHAPRNARVLGYLYAIQSKDTGNCITTTIKVFGHCH